MHGFLVNWHVPGETTALVKWHPGRKSVWEQNKMSASHTAWELAPTLNPQTGLPYSFLEMPRQLHVQLWSQAARRVLPQGRYAALLVSLHGTRLYQRYNAANDLPENARAVQHYLEQERSFQKELLASLRSDPYYRIYAIEEVVARNQQLVGIWDALFSTALWQNVSAVLGAGYYRY